MSVLSKIQQEYDGLTKGQRKVADYIYQNLELASMQTSTQISQKIAVSGSTVIRLAYSLGFESYSEMQAQMKKEVLSRIVTDRSSAEVGGRLQTTIDQEIAILSEMKNGLIDADQLRGIAKRIYDADMVMIIGYYGEHTASFQLYLLLDSIRDNVFYYRQNNEGYRRAMLLNEKSVIIASATEPYAPGTLRLLKEMRTTGAYGIAFTDSPLCELAREADEHVTIKVGSDPVTHTHRMMPLTLLYSVLFEEVVDIDPEGALDYLRRVPSQLIQPSVNGFLDSDLGGLGGSSGL